MEEENSENNPGAERLIEGMNKEVRIDNNPDKKMYFSKITKNPWMISTVVFGVIALVLLVMVFRNGGITGGVIGVQDIISEEDAGEKMLEFANLQGANAQLVEVKDDGIFYEVVLLIQGQDMPLYVTKDGESFTQALIPLDLDAISQQQQQAPQSSQEDVSENYSEEDLGKIKEFSKCLLDANMVVYGAGWCPDCQNLIKYFGGKEIIAPIYIECSDKDRNPTENEELCLNENIRSLFPTIKIDGEPYVGDRTFEGFSEATDCSVPEIQTI